MAAKLSVLIDATDSTDHVFRAVERVRRNQGIDVEILVLCSSSMPPELMARLQAIWSRSRVTCVSVMPDAPGAVRNSGIDAASGDLVMFLEAGDAIDQAYPELASRRLAASEGLDFVTAWAHRPTHLGLGQLTKPVLSLDAMLTSSDALPGPTVFRRAAWESAGRFDETLPSYEWNDFWIRLLARGCRGELIEQPLIGHEPSRTSAYRKRLRPHHAPGMKAMLEKHLSLFREHASRALCDREATLRDLSTQYSRLVRRRNSLVEDRGALQTQTDRALERLREIGNDSFDWGDLRRVLPVSANWGYERGIPIDRYYIERFLEACAPDIQGTVLEIQEPDYTRRFGRDRVTRSDVIDVDIENMRANVTGDLRRLDGLPSGEYDCFILTQTIHVINDMRAVLREAVRILKPGGILLVTMPCASRVCLEYGPDGDFWRVTEAGVRELLGEFFPSSHMAIRTFGNVLTNAAFAAGLACHEISAEEFESYDPFNPMLVGVRAVKPSETSVAVHRDSRKAAAILLYHRVTEPSLDIHRLCITPHAFREQMLHLKEEYQPVPLAQLAMAAREGWLPERAVAITFDDGYVDNLVAASPILSELGIPATFFITSDGLLGRPHFWWDVLESVFFGSLPVPSRLEIELEGQLRMLPTATAEEKAQAHWELYHTIRKAGPEVRLELMQRLEAWADRSADAVARAMDRVELQELARRPGHSIGGHGAHHLSFSAHPYDIVRSDVRENRRLVEAVVGRLVTCFAYPFGDHNDQAVEIVQDAGYRAAVTCETGLVRAGTNPLRLPRLAVGPDEAADFANWLRSTLQTAVKVTA